MKTKSAPNEQGLPKVSVVGHPLAAANLTRLRAKTTGPEEFRRNLRLITMFVGAEASRGWQMSAVEIETPLQNCAGVALADPVVLVPIMRAGLGMVEGMLRLLPAASIGHIGLYRDETTLRPVSYYCRFPANLADAHVLVLDPMLATGFSASEAVTTLKEKGARRIQFLCLVGYPAGIEQFHSVHPDVDIITAAIDPELDARGYIVPGLGDAGDRYFGTE